jgi:hypothetical protein
MATQHPKQLKRNVALTDETNLSAHSESFAFLKHEPELYSVGDAIRMLHGVQARRKIAQSD